MSNFKVQKLKHVKQTPIVKSKSDVATSGVHTESPTPGIPGRKVRIFILILLIGIGGFFAVNFAMEHVSQIQIGGDTQGISSSFREIEFIGESGSTTPPPKQGVTNILILGVGGSGHQGGDLADSIMLASIDPSKGSVTMISIPRDLYVAYPNKLGAGKINALYPLGLSHSGAGISWIAQKVSEITGQGVNHYMVIDFTAFRYIVDALGGIEINVEHDLYDREYPDYNYGYTIFSVKKGLQTFNGETALRYARSRHSTSDFDRSRRQQQIISAIKSKALSLGIITSPSKISDLISATQNNISTDLTVGDIMEFGSALGKVQKEGVHLYNLGSDCFAYNNCQPGAYLYSPSMAYFGGAWSLIPEGASLNKLSTYTDIRRFVSLVFEYPGIHLTEQPISMIYNKKSLNQAKSTLIGLKKIGINYNPNTVLSSTTGSIARSHINIYWNTEHQIGINPDSDIVAALRSLDIRMPINIVQSNEYITDHGPRIEIVCGDDCGTYFGFSRSPYYLPKIETPTVSGETSNTKTSTQSGQSKAQNPVPVPTKNGALQKTPPPSTPSKNPTYKVAPGEWEDL